MGELMGMHVSTRKQFVACILEDVTTDVLKDANSIYVNRGILGVGLTQHFGEQTYSSLIRIAPLRVGSKVQTMHYNG